MSDPPPAPPSSGSASPAPDDEVERRLAALKAGADPASFGPSGDTAGPSPAPSTSSQPPASSEAADTDGPRPHGATGAEGADAGAPPPALTGEVIDAAGRTWTPRGGPAGASPTGAARPGSLPGPGVRVVGWGISQAEAGRLGLWIGLALVAFGGYLVLAEFVPGLSIVGSLALAILGVILVAWHLAGRAGAWAVHAGVVLAGFGGARLVAEVAALPPAGWGTLGAGLGLLLIAVVRIGRGEGVHWQAWVGGALAIFGGWGVLGATIPGFPTLGDLIVPLILVLIGVAVLRRGVRPPRQP